MSIDKIGFQPKLNKINNNFQNSSNISFKSLRTDVFKYASNVNTTPWESSRFVGQVAAYLNVKKREIIPFAAKSQRHKRHLLYQLAEKYNLNTYNNPNIDKTANKKLVFEIYNKIKSPQNTHKQIIESTNYTLEQLNRLFNITEKDAKKLQLADDLISTYPYKADKSRLPFEVLDEFLNAPYSDKIAKDFDEFKPYIKLNNDNPQIVKNLTDEINKGYNKSFYLKKLNIKELNSMHGLSDIIPSSLIEENYNPSGVALLKRLNKSYAGESKSKYSDRSSIQEILQKIYTSTTPDNLNLRKSVFKYIQSHIDINNKLEEAPLETVYRIFEKTDSDKQAKKFMDLAMYNKAVFSSISQIDDTLSKADLKRLNSRFDLVKYALLNNENLVEFSKKDFSIVDRQIRKSESEAKKMRERVFFTPNPLIMDLHRMKVKINRFFEKHFTNNQ